ncbi:hypothetical protein U128_04795 [Anaplasma marginale str. Gypsy Plains]|nr:hypothetical protein U128_04795 [Anaplasma marginale str. Gypsy Plains]
MRGGCSAADASPSLIRCTAVRPLVWQGRALLLLPFYVGRSRQWACCSASCAVCGRVLLALLFPVSLVAVKVMAGRSVLLHGAFWSGRPAAVSRCRFSCLA